MCDVEPAGPDMYIAHHPHQNGCQDVNACVCFIVQWLHVWGGEWWWCMLCLLLIQVVNPGGGGGGGGGMRTCMRTCAERGMGAAGFLVLLAWIPCPHLPQPWCSHKPRHAIHAQPPHKCPRVREALTLSSPCQLQELCSTSLGTALDAGLLNNPATGEVRFSPCLAFLSLFSCPFSVFLFPCLLCVSWNQQQ